MSNYLRRAAVLFLFFFLFPQTSFSSQDSAPNGEDGSVIDVLGKVSDKDYFELAGGYKLYLPRFFFVDGEFYAFPNTKAAIASGEFTQTDEGLLRADGAAIGIDFSITSHLVYVWIAFFLSFLITMWAAGRYKRGIGDNVEPQGALQNIFETVFVFVRDDIAKEFIPEDKYRKYVAYLFTIFLAITFLNLFGLLPWGAAATANITVTATLALITFAITQFSGTKDYWAHVFVFPGVPAWSRIILTPVEFLGLFTKPFALAIRLFANMLAGKIMIVSILGLVFVFADLFGAAAGYGSGIFWVLLTAALYFLKALVALIQAYVFTLLSAVFIGMAAEEHHHEHDESSVAHAQDVQL
ncbi:MAG: F0F1 ATP synthase subunit A [Balneolaceae bacterium]